MKSYRTLTLLAAAVVLAGCKTDSGIEDQESPVALVVQSITPVGTPTPFGDVRVDENGAAFGDSIDITLASVIINQNPGSPGVTEATELNDIILERMRITWSRIDGGVDLPPNREDILTNRVTPGGTLTITGLEVLSALHKFEFPLFYLRSDSLGFEPSTGFFSIQAAGTIEFFGRTLAGKPVHARGQFRIEWTDWADSATGT